MTHVQSGQLHRRMTVPSIFRTSTNSRLFALVAANITSKLPINWTRFQERRFGGHQTARTLHFFDTLFLMVFLLVHILMVYLGGFRKRMRGMIMGGAREDL